MAFARPEEQRNRQKPVTLRFVTFSLSVCVQKEIVTCPSFLFLVGAVYGCFLNSGRAIP